MASSKCQIDSVHTMSCTKAGETGLKGSEVVPKKVGGDGQSSQVMSLVKVSVQNTQVYSPLRGGGLGGRY